MRREVVLVVAIVLAAASCIAVPPDAAYSAYIDWHTLALLSGFTSQWDALIVGTNLGGLGTLVASMASLITFKAISIGRAGAKIHYLKVFTKVNVVFLAALLGFALLFDL